MNEPVPHHFDFANDEFRVTIDAKCPDWTWHTLIGDVIESLAKPPRPLTSPDDPEALRTAWLTRWRS